LYRITSGGLQVWTYETTSNGIYVTPTIDQSGFIYFSTYEKDVFCLYPNSTIRWRRSLNENIKSAMAIDDERNNLVFGTTEGNLYAINCSSGNNSVVL